ncbi:cobyric acid synthase [Candidatus Poribacteria bacterium]|nr:cobyric acid synthase [Candidatus Poribacteria bacterium]
MRAKSIMIQGTGSHVGKSLIVTALCRIFYQDGFRVVPFKAQNMSLNSYATPEGREISIAQAVQAEACGIEPSFDMNPILLKPMGDAGCQVVLHGKPYMNLSAKRYYNIKAELWEAVRRSFERLKDEFDIIVIEGAGSPAEVNLRENDIVNMKMARYAEAPVLLVGDIDRGGVLAWIVGTIELLTQEERELIKGLIINKFRGDISLLKPGVDFLEEKTGKPVIGVIPYIRGLRIWEEDSVSLDGFRPSRGKADIRIAVLRLPRISNFTDFDPLASESDVSLRYVTSPDELEDADIIIIPGTKNTVYDLLFLKESGLFEGILRERRRGKMIIGICGGFQMLGRKVEDPHGVESERKIEEGLGLLDIVTIFTKEKASYQVKAKALREIPYLDEGELLEGYEIHMGETKAKNYLFELSRLSGERVWDGVISHDGLVLGTYLHGIFENGRFRRRLLNLIRRRKGLLELASQDVNTRLDRQGEYDRLAEVIRENLDVDFIYKLLGLI